MVKKSKPVEGFKGEKVKKDDVLNQIIEVTDFDIRASYYNDRNYALIQGYVNGKLITFPSGDKPIVRELRKTPKEKLPFSARLVKKKGKKGVYCVFEYQ